MAKVPTSTPYRSREWLVSCTILGAFSSYGLQYGVVVDRSMAKDSNQDLGKILLQGHGLGCAVLHG